ncbi:MAG TPA: hypothetical protein VIH57_21090 [Bacteroidales bacterium]
MDIIEKLERIYFKNTGSDFSFLTKYNIPKSEVSTIVALYDFNNYEVNSSIDFFINTYRKVNGNIKILQSGLNDFLKFYKKIITDSNFIQFIELLAKLHINTYTNSFIKSGYILPSLPDNPIEHSIYVDLATGPDFINFYNSLDPCSIYYLVDKSVFSCKVLEFKSKNCNLQNIKIINKGVEDLSSNDFNNVIGVVRAKNLFRYVGLYPELISFLQNLIETNGIFVFQEHSQSQTMKNKVYPNLKCFFNDEWECSYSEGDINNPLDLDTMSFTKK